jgi:hypothetical protein
MAPPLAAKSKLSVGYGEANIESFEFSLTENVDWDVTFLRLFVSTTYVDMKVLEQSSPFFADRGGKATNPGSHDLWDAWTYVLKTKRQGIGKPT